MNQHVADVAECERLLPPRAIESARLLAQLGVDVVFMVNEDTGTIDGGHAVDTVRDQFFTFVVIDVDGWEFVVTSDYVPLSAD